MPIKTVVGRDGTDTPRYLQTVSGTDDTDILANATDTRFTGLTKEIFQNPANIAEATGAALESTQVSVKTAVEALAAALPAGTNNIGDVDVLTLPAIPAGTNAIGKLLPPDVDITTHANYARKYYTSTGAATDGIVWSPAAGKRWHVVALYINVSAAATVTLEDDKVAGDDPVFKAELAANDSIFLTFPEKYPMASGEDAADLLITTSAANVYVSVVGYEV